MIVVLLAIIAGCLLFGSAAVLGFLEGGFWVAIILIVVALALVAILISKRAAVHLFDKASVALHRQWRKTFPPKKSPPLEIDGVQFIDRQDYMDWANREGRWADEMRIEHTRGVLGD
jgi:hypothetical protein